MRGLPVRAAATALMAVGAFAAFTQTAAEDAAVRWGGTLGAVFFALSGLGLATGHRWATVTGFFAAVGGLWAVVSLSILGRVGPFPAAAGIAWAFSVIGVCLALRQAPAGPEDEHA